MTWQEGAGFNRPALSAGLPRWVVRCQALTRPPLPPLPSPQFLSTCFIEDMNSGSNDGLSPLSISALRLLRKCLWSSKVASPESTFSLYLPHMSMTVSEFLAFLANASA